MNILLVDDEELQLKRLKDAVGKVLPDASLACYTNPVKAWEDNKSVPVDIAFLDIEMPVLSGIILAKRLKAIRPTVNIIFVTAYDQYALEAYRMHASGYVTKPASEAKVKAELEGLRYPVSLSPTRPLQVKCFGNFEIFHDGVPLKFGRSKSKELLAYLIDREGAAVNANELNSILWEEDKQSYFRNLIADIRTTLKGAGAEGAFVKRHNECYVDVDFFDCDAYRYKKGDPEAIRAYRGEYMAQYDWAVFDADSY